MTKVSPFFQFTGQTIRYYESSVESFWEATKDHDVTQNYEALLNALPRRKGLRILDFGCGPGRDLAYFKKAGHEPSGLDGTKAFCEMAERFSGCPVLHQNFLELKLPKASFDGIFANASLFHVPKSELVRILKELKEALVPNGILFSSNPRGKGEDFSGERYAHFMEIEDYEIFLQQAGFKILKSYYRPTGQPCSEQPWLAVVSQAL